MKYLITGGCGFLGSNIASALLKQKQKVIIFDNMSRTGAFDNLTWLREQGNFAFVHGDIRKSDDVLNIIAAEKPDVIYHLAGQVAMTTSLKNPRLDFETNAFGSFNVLEAVRITNPNTIIIYSSTNKVYGDLEYLEYPESPTRYLCPQYSEGFPETLALDFHSPYGVSKGSADQYMLDYARMFNLKTVVFRHSSMYGGRQFATCDQGWIGWFCQQAIETRINSNRPPFTISGSGKQVRDLLYADDMVNLYIDVVKHIEKVKGEAFNIGGGINNSLSLLELLDYLSVVGKVKLNYKHIPVRESDQKIFIADTKKIEAMIGWRPTINWTEGINLMLGWVEENVK